MLSKKQKTIMTVLGSIGLLVGLVVAIPFRSFPGLNHIANILRVELILDLVLGVVAMLLVIYPLTKKYKLLEMYRENSKIVLVMCYFPILCYIIGAITNLIYTLSFNYIELGMVTAVSDKVLGIVIAVLTVYLIFTIYCIFRLPSLVMKLDKLGNTLLDFFLLIIAVCFIVVSFRVNFVYNDMYSFFDQYFVGNPLLFIIYILLIIGFGLAIKFIVQTVKKDETLIYYNSNKNYEDFVKNVEYNHAYNDTLDDFENYFDANYDEYDKLEIEEVDEFEEEKVDNVTKVSLDSNESSEDTTEPVVDIDDNTEVAESEELKQITKEKAELLAQIDEKNKVLAEVRQKKNDVETAEEELRKAKEAFASEYAEYNQYKLDHAGEEVEEAPKKKEKKITPSFEKVVEYVNSFSETKDFKVNANAKGNLLKFYIGKKMFLVLQSTNNDYRISFIASEEKFVNYVTSRPGEINVPKNLKDNNWLRFVNKGKEKESFIRQIIKQAVTTATDQIKTEEEAKAAARKAKAAERAKERAAKRALEKAKLANETQGE